MQQHGSDGVRLMLEFNQVPGNAVIRRGLAGYMEVREN